MAPGASGARCGRKAVMALVVIALVLATAVGTLGLAGPLPWLLVVPLGASALLALPMPRGRTSDGYPW